MTAVSVRQSGGANIVSIPKKIVQTLGLSVGSKFNLSIQNNSILLTPIEDEPTLEELLEGSPKGCFMVTDQDRTWIDAVPSGKEA